MLPQRSCIQMDSGVSLSSASIILGVVECNVTGSQDSVHKPPFLEGRGEQEADSNPSPSFTSREITPQAADSSGRPWTEIALPVGPRTVS